MKTFKTLVISAVSLLPAVAFASSTTHSLKVNVPFSFVVAGENFSAGNYNVSETDSGVVTVQGQGKAAAVISTPSGAGDATCLRFTSNGRQEYLTGIDVQGGERRNVSVRALLVERKLAMGASK